MALGDMWRRTLVYFGMADDPDDYYDDEDEPPTRSRPAAASSRRSAPVEDVDRGHRERERERQNVRRLGTRRTEDYEDVFPEDRPSRPVMRSVESRPQPAEVHLVVPKNFNDAQQIGDKFKNGVPVILNLQSAETDLAKRLIDFSSGLTYALDGGMQRVADKVFMVTPRNVEVSAEERARLLEKGFFNQY